MSEKLNVKILGGGCKNCHTLEENTKKALDEMNADYNIELVTDFAEISKYGVMQTPALVINEEVKSYGKVLKPDSIKKFI